MVRQLPILGEVDARMRTGRAQNSPLPERCPFDARGIVALFRTFHQAKVSPFVNHPEKFVIPILSR